MRVDELAPSRGSKKKAKRVGRGIGGKGGKTAGRGTKGQYARNTVKRGFEGGLEFYAVNLDVIEALGLSEVDPQILVQKSAAHKGTLIKVLGRGKITKAVKVSAHAVSETAEKAIIAAGGSVTIVPMPHKGVRPAAKGSQFTNR